MLLSGYLLLLDMDFIDLFYLLVYIRPVSILFLFILMLINIKISEMYTKIINSLPLAIVISISFYISLYEIIPFNLTERDSLNYDYDSSIIDVIKSTASFYTEQWKDINYFISNQMRFNLIEVIHITGIGNVLYTNYFLWLYISFYYITFSNGRYYNNNY